jgi:hypothetical protein
MPNPRQPNGRNRAAQNAGERNSVAASSAGDLKSALSALVEERPQSKFGQLRRIWPEIKAVLRDGHQVKYVWEHLVQNGVELSYSKFRTYVARLRSLETSGADLPTLGVDVQTARPTAAIKDAVKRDAVSNLRERLNKRRGFEYDERPPDEKKLI